MSTLPPTRLTSRMLVAGFASLMVTAAPCTAQHGPTEAAAPPREYSTRPIASSEVEGWRADLQALLEGLESIHPEPYAQTPRADFEAVVAGLHDRIPALPAHAIIIEFARILALVGDGHTSLALYFAPGVDFRVLPYRLGVYEDGLWVEAADEAYIGLVGGRVMEIGGVGAEEALARVTPLISRDNDNWIAAVAPNLLNRIEVLHALGMADGLDEVEVVVERSGERRQLRVAALREPPQPALGVPFLPRFTDNWVDARDLAPRPEPLYQRAFADLYMWEYLAGEDLLYIKWDQVQNRPEGPAALDIFREAMAFARERRPSRTVIDIRNNTGGEGGLLPPVIREILRTREIDEPGSLFLVIGRRTFSAGQMMTSWLQQFSSAILVGEPSSAFYNGYAGHEFVHLPHSGIGFAVSPDFYQMGHWPRDPRQQATPTLAAIPTFEDYRLNRDPALEAILAYEHGALERQLVGALQADGQERALALVRAYNQDPVNRFRDASIAVNALGYRLQGEGRRAEALAVFELNVRAHPRYANGWDSLGEAYLHAGRRDEAVAAFRRAIEIEPGFPPSVEWLRRLGQGH